MRDAASKFVLASEPRTGQSSAGSLAGAIALGMPYGLLLAAVLVLALLQPPSFSVHQLQSSISLSIVLVVLAMGQGIVALSGGLDLSIGGVISVVNTLCAVSMGESGSSVSASAIILALGWLPGMINGVLVTVARMQPFIVTLSTWFIWGGVAFYILPGPGGAIDPTLSGMLSRSWLGLGATTWLFLALGVFGLWFQATGPGLSIRAIGSDRRSAQQSGIGMIRTEILAYVLSGWFAVLGGLLLSAQTLAGEPRVGSSYILPTITAVVVGGVNLGGGQGSLLGPMVGALVLAYLSAITYSLRLQPQWAQILQGALLIGSIAATVLLGRVARGRGPKGA